MSTKPIETILTRNVFEIDTKTGEFARDVSSMIEEIVNFYTIIFHDAIQTRSKSKHLEDTAIFLLFLNTLELADCISVSINNALISPSYLQLRSIFETFLYIKYLTIEKEYYLKRSISYLILHETNEIRINKQFISGTNQNILFLNALHDNEIQIPFDGKAAEKSAKHNIEIHEKRLQEIQNNWPSIYSEYEVNYSNVKNWYSLYNGPKDIRCLARKVKRELDYILIYKKISELSHCNDIINRYGRRMSINNQSGFILRDISELRDLSIQTLQYLNFILLKFTNFLGPEFKKNHRIWYLQEISKKYNLDSTHKCNKAGRKKVSRYKIRFFRPTRVKGALMSYKQLTCIQRYQIYALLKTGQNQATLAKVLNVHRSTISRELQRNKGQRGYRPAQAHCIAIKRHYKHKPKITRADWAIVEVKLREELSPEQVSNWVKEHNNIEISHEWIYQYVWHNKRCKGMLYKHLRRKKKYRKRSGNRDNRGKIPNRIGIEERPEIVGRRERIGDWEADTIIGKGMKGAMVTLVDRKSRFLRIGLVARRTKDAVADTIISLLGDLPVHTITCDNGKEFADHEKIALALNAEVYFAHPYASWERGTNENTNGLIRQYFPKDMYFSNLSTSDIMFVENRLNSRPRKCLSFAQPMVILNNHCCT